MAQAVREVMTKNPVMLQANDTLVEAARKMRDADVGNVLVMDGSRLKGIVTDRDITIRGVANGKDPNRSTLSEVCSPQLVTIPADKPVDDAVKLMREKSVRRLPVVDGDKAVGVVSIGDLAVEKDSKSALADISSAEPNR